MKKAHLKKFFSLIESFEALPGIGKRRALRLAYHLIFKDKFLALKLSNAIEDGVRGVKMCSECGGISENNICDICLEQSRDNEKICFVKSPKDIFLIEESGTYSGYYFVIDYLKTYGVDKLRSKIIDKGIKEVIFALSPSVENDTMILFLEDKLSNMGLSFTKIAQGVPTGVSLDNVDGISLSKALEFRIKI